MGEVPAWSHGHGRSAHWPEDRAIELRSAEREDEAFLYRVYASTRTDELAVLDWSEAQKEAAIASKEYLERSGGFGRPIVTQIVPAGEFYMAEDYHQQYLEKRGLASCHI